MNKIISLSLLMVLGSAFSVFAQNSEVAEDQNKNGLPSMSKVTTVDLPYTTQAKDRVVGAVDVIDGDNVRKSNEYRTNAALPGLAAGMYVMKYGNQPGSSSAGFKVRGRSRGGSSDGPMIVVDGIPFRNLYDIPMENIESITVLKDATAKILYGPSAANGVILATTKRGGNRKKTLSFSAEGGLKLPTAKAEYLDAATYAEKYNEARRNDGLEDLYSQDEIDLYRSQIAPLSYPDQDYREMFLKDMTDFERITATLDGGDDKTQYFLNAAYTREMGLENVENNNQYNQLDLTSNLDYKVSDVVSVNLDLAVKMALRNNSNFTAAEFFSALATHRPNEYPVYVSKDGNNPDSLGWGTKPNIFGELEKTGYTKTETYTTKTALGIDFNFNKMVEGLSARADLAFDTWNSIAIGKSLTYASYKVITEDSLMKVGVDQKTGNEKKMGDNFTRLINGNAQINYDRAFGDHALTMNGTFNLSQQSFKTTQDGLTTKQDDKSITAALRANYAFKNKYILEGSAVLMGSDKFQRGNRYGTFGAGGAAWVISNEDFMADGPFDLLKLKGSYGVMGYDNSLDDYFLFRDEYGGAGSYRFGLDNSSLPVYGQKATQLANPDITFEKSREWNIGLEGVVLENALSFEVNYFNEYRYDIPVMSKTQIPSYVSSVYPTLNYNEISNVGVDASLEYAKMFGDLELVVGGNIMYTKSMHEKVDELNLYEHQNKQGKETDAIWGWVFDGFYGSQDEIDTYGVVSTYGDIIPGDIKLKDITNDLGDNQIDTYDRTVIGHSYPRINYAMKVNARYKGFELYVLGQGIANVDKMLTSPYYYNTGERKYSTEVLRDDYPRLTVNSTSHSYRSSSYWMDNGAYFKLRTLQLSYTLPESVSNVISSKRISFFLEGTDLFAISPIKDLDPEDINGGVSKYPLYTTYSLGAKIAF